MKFLTHEFTLGFFIIANVIPPFTQLNLPGLNTPSLRNLIEQNAYVDKTNIVHLMIHKVLEKGGWNFVFLTRPSRFGKSLLVDTLNEFFQGERDLFNGTYISEFRQSNYSWTKYPIIRLDFSAMPCRSQVEFNASLIGKLKKIAASNGLDTLSGKTVENVTEEILYSLNKTFGLPAVVLVDDYDIPYLSQHEFNSSEAKKILGTMQSFFSQLKRMSSFIHFCLITGVVRVPVASSPSGLNTYLDISLKPEYATIVGFTKQELIDNYKDAIENVARIQSNTTEGVLQEMELWFDGYQFSCESERVYNPISVVRYLTSKGWETKFWAESGRHSYLLRKLKEFPSEALEVAKLHRIGLPIPKFSYPAIVTLRSSALENEGYVDLEKETFHTLLQMLVYTGYVTLSSCKIELDGLGTKYSLRFPNYEIQSEYPRHISPVIFLQDSQRFIYLAESAKKSIISGQWVGFISKLNEFLAKTPSKLFPSNEDTKTNATDKHYQVQVLYQSLMIFAGFNWVELDEKTNDNSSRDNADVVVLDDHDAIYITITKSAGNYTENPLDRCSKKYVPKFLNSEKKILCIGIVFAERIVSKWGICVYSNEGKFLEHDGQIRGTFTNGTIPEVHSTPDH